jgi:short-subunit dehydrogenase
MAAAGKGHIVNIASSAGMAACPRISVYVASKWAAIGWSESLRLEMEEKGNGIRVTTVTPYLIGTGMFEGAKSSVIPILKPEAVAERILRDVERNRLFSRMPGIVYAMPFFHGVLPQRWFDRIVGGWFGIHGMMRDFKGRSQK